ncbi:hypothetical protein O181_090759 [Austropuccinia psidii MF-1]|uniref:Uncharacterized protein n=1 Tax=Austropuccinia psidii MF-1 TaxID=1389203 RepID=A0A9Q3P786_9BASI|nr:hypothetical protein [Austropuccinia psidii MF-1]
MLRWQIAIQEYRGDMIIIYKEGKSHTNSDGLRIWPLDNVKCNPAYEPAVPAKIPMHSMEKTGGRTSNFLNEKQNLVPQTVIMLNQKEQKLPYRE